MSTRFIHHVPATSVARRSHLRAALLLIRKAVARPFQVLRRWREEEELYRYLATASRSERADLAAMGLQLPPRRPDANQLLHTPWLR